MIVYVLYEPDSQAVRLDPSLMGLYTSLRKAAKEMEKRNRAIGWERWAIFPMKVKGRK